MREGSSNTSDLAHSTGWKCTCNFRIQSLEELPEPQKLPSLFRSTLQMNCCLPGFSAAWVASEWTVRPPLWCLTSFASPASTANHWQASDIDGLFILSLSPAWASVRAIMERQFNADQINCICQMGLKHFTGSFPCRHSGVW